MTVGAQVNSIGALNIASNGSFTSGSGGQMTVNKTGSVNISTGGTLSVMGNLNVIGSVTVNPGTSFSFLGSSLAVSSGGIFLASSNRMALNAGQSASVSGSGSLMETFTMILDSGSTLNMNGGTARSNFQFGGGTVSFNSGTLHHTGSLTADSISTVLGSDATLGGGRTLIVDGTSSVPAGMTLDGGRFSTGNLTGGQSLTLNRGTMQLTGSALSVSSGGQFGSLLNLGNGMTVETTNGNAATIASNGRVVVNGGTLGSAGTLTNNGEVQLTSAQSTLRGGTLVNNSMLVGTGRIENGLQNNATGTVQVAGGERLVFSGSSNVNTGHLNSTDGGRLEFRSAVTNNAGGLIGGSDGNLRFDGGLVNNGAIAISAGATDIFGDINNAAGGIINISGGSAATFFEDVIQNGTMQIVSVGNTNSSAIIFGSLSGAGGFTGGGDLFALGDLRPGNSPDSVLYDGNLFLGSPTDTFIELGGLGVGDFDQLVVTGDLGVAGSLSVSLINGFTLDDNMQFLIGDVGGSLTGQFAGLGEGALVGSFGGRDPFITYHGGGGNGVSLFTSIPEPGVAGIGLLAVFGLLLVRRRPASSRGDQT